MLIEKGVFKYIVIFYRFGYIDVLTQQSKKINILTYLFVSILICKDV